MVNYFAPRCGAKYYDEYLCLSVYFPSVCSHLENYRPNFSQVQSFSGGVALCYALPVLWLLCFHKIGSITCKTYFIFGEKCANIYALHFPHKRAKHL